MAAGEVDLPKARVIVDGVAALDLDLARSIVAAILPQAPALTTGELRARLAKLVIQADPDAAVKRHKARKKQRRVELQPTEDSCAALLGLNLPADDALAAIQPAHRVRAGAQAGRRPAQHRPATRGHLPEPVAGQHLQPPHPSPATVTAAAAGGTAERLGQRQRARRDRQRGGGGGSGSTAAARLAVARRQWLAGRQWRDRRRRDGGGSTAAARPAVARPAAADGSCSCSCGGSSRYRGGVELTGDLETLAGLAERPGDLGGYGAVIAEIARQVAAQQRRSPWTFTIRDPATGQIFTGPVRRRPTAAMARHIRARDRTCRAPGCRRIGIYADIDHTIADEHGGLTVPGNLGLLCRYHHRAKHEGWWLLVQVRPGVFVWRSPLGRRYTVYPAAP